MFCRSERREISMDGRVPRGGRARAAGLGSMVLTGQRIDVEERAAGAIVSWERSVIEGESRDGQAHLFGDRLA